MINIQFITHQTPRYSYIESAQMALEGGCRWIQLRMKEATDDEIIDAANQIKPMCKQHHATFIIDDHVELAKRIHADGVHLGQQDMPIDQARQILGHDYIIGGTANTFEEIVSHWQQGANYIGCGPFRFTSTKKRLAPILGIDGYNAIINKMKQHGINIPIIAIGGIGYDDINSLLKIGLNGIALSSAILQADDPIVEMQRIMTIKSLHS